MAEVIQKITSIEELDGIEVHEVALKFPRIIGGEAEQFRQSIRENSVHDPLVGWMESSGKKWIVDGGSRLEFWKQLVEAKEIDPKQSPLPIRWLDAATKADVWARVIDEQLVRRHMDAGQRAVVAHRLRDEIAKMRGTKANHKNIAEAAGVSETYVRDVAEVEKEAPELIEEVMAGIKTLPQAVDEVRQKQNKPPRQKRKSAESNGSQSHEEESEKPKIPEAPPVFDDAGKLVPEHLLGAWTARGKCAEVNVYFNAIRKWVGDAMNPSGKYDPTESDVAPGFERLALAEKEFRASMTHAKRLLKQSMPSLVCVECDGLGKVERKKCEVCAGNGYLDLQQSKVGATAEQ